MGRITTYIIILSTLVLVFHMGGLVAQSSYPSLLGLLLNPQNMQDSTLNLTILLAAEGLVLAGAVILGLRTNNFELVAIAPVALFLLNIFADFIAVYLVLRAENQAIANLILAPIILLFFITVLDWWRGRD